MWKNIALYSGSVTVAVKMDGDLKFLYGPLLIEKTKPNDGIEHKRSSFDPPLEDHFADRNGLVPANGSIVSRGTVNQFHSEYFDLVSKYNTADAICGYMTAATCRRLCAAALRETATEAEPDDALIERLLNVVRHRQTMKNSVEGAMVKIQGDRSQYIQANLSKFGGNVNSKKAKNYMKAWVANYELGDLLESSIPADQASKFLTFFRMNQWPELDQATHQERDRLKDEERFGGRRTSKGAVTYGDNDSVFILERFGKPGVPPGQRLQTPNEWLEEEKTKTPPVVRIFAIDLAGHFNAAIALNHKTKGPMVVMLNSHPSTPYHLKPQLPWLFDLLFPATEANGVQCGQVGKEGDDGKDGDSPTISEGLKELLAMGFDEERSRNALAATNGIVNEAIELLL